MAISRVAHASAYASARAARTSGVGGAIRRLTRVACGILRNCCTRQAARHNRTNDQIVCLLQRGYSVDGPFRHEVGPATGPTAESGDDAVRYQPLSTPKFPFIREITGNFLDVMLYRLSCKRQKSLRSRGFRL